MKQRTLKKSCIFEGVGLHTGKYAHMTVCPAPADSGVVFVRTDMNGAVVKALAENVSSTARSTTLSTTDGASVATVEHLLSSLSGLGIDNALVEIDNVEIPILDGSASRYIAAFTAAGFEEQDAERRLIDVPEEIEVKLESGSYVKVIPSDEPSMDITVDFNSKVLGVQTAHWDLSTDYSTQIGPCRTFVFFHELEFLASQGLVKGGDMDNAIVVVEHPVTSEQIGRLSKLFQVPEIKEAQGYLTNLSLHFPDECGRHKLLDLLGDMRLCGGYLRAKIIAYKPGHGINTTAAKAVRAAVQTKKSE